MDTASIMSIFGSVDTASFVPPMAAIGPLIESIFSAITATINIAVSGSAASAGSIQNILGSIAGQ